MFKQYALYSNLKCSQNFIPAMSGWLTNALRKFKVDLRGSQTPQGGLQRLSVTLGWLTEALKHFKVAHRGSQIPQGDSQRLSDTCGSQRFSETSGLAHRSSQNSHRSSNTPQVAHRNSHTTQNFSQLSDTSGLLIETIKHLNVACIGSQIPQGSSQRFSDTSVWHKDSQILQAGSQRLSDISG